MRPPRPTARREPAPPRHRAGDHRHRDGRRGGGRLARGLARLARGCGAHARGRGGARPRAVRGARRAAPRHARAVVRFAAARDPRRAGERGPLLGIAGVGLVANLVSLRILHHGHEHSLNQRGAYLHVLGDLLGSVGALAAGGIVVATGWVVADPLISVLITLLVLGSAWRLIKESTDILMEATPNHIALGDVHDRIASVAGVDSVHDLHVWTVTSGVVAMSGHLMVRNPTDNQPVLEIGRASCRERV